MKHISRKRLAIVIAVVALPVFILSYGCELNEIEKTPLIEYDKSAMSTIEQNLRKTVHVLSQEIGSRGYLQLQALNRAADFITAELRSYGYTVSFQSYEYQGNTYKNISVEIVGASQPERILLVGAHYDTVTGTPGADDNASGVAGLLELARLLKNSHPGKTIRFVAFTLEEPPLFRSKFMGSAVYAERAKNDGAAIEGMICLETVGYYSDAPGSQEFPLPFFRLVYPDTGNFITFVSDLSSRGFLNRAKAAFQKGSALPVESISTLSIVPGVDFSDHRSFWKQGFNAFMVTDTAFYRNPNYHGINDTPETLDYRRMAELVTGMGVTLEDLAGSGD